MFKSNLNKLFYKQQWKLFNYLWDLNWITIVLMQLWLFDTKSNIYFHVNKWNDTLVMKIVDWITVWKKKMIKLHTRHESLNEFAKSSTMSSFITTFSTSAIRNNLRNLKLIFISIKLPWMWSFDKTPIDRNGLSKNISTIQCL